VPASLQRLTLAAASCNINISFSIHCSFSSTRPQLISHA
jgi:hypothetical protein